MKDLVITSKRLKKETYIIATCFLIASLINIAAIILYKTPWYEIFTQIGYVVFITSIFYFLTIFFRLIIYMIRRLYRRIH